jgi:signal transduction histidine kinase
MAMTSTLALPEIVDHVVTVIRQDLDLEHLNFLLVNEELGRLESIGGDVEERLLKNARLSELHLGQGCVGWVAERGVPLRIGDVSRDPRHVTTGSLWPPGVRSALIVPLVFADRVVGVIDAASSRLDAFDDADERVMTAVARQLAFVVENTRRYRETEKQLAEMSALYQLAQQINVSLDLDQVLDSIVWSLKRTLGCRGCSIALLAPVNDVLGIHTAVGIKRKWEREFRLRLGEGIAGRVALDGVPIYVPDATEHDNFIFFDPSVRSLLTVPLTLHQQIIGTLTVDSDQTHAFSKSDERLLTIAATQAAIAIENARLYTELEQRAQNLAEAYAELKQANRLKDEIARNVSHELRTPLTFVKSYVELLKSSDTESLSSEQREHLAIVVEKIDVVTKLVSDIMALQQAEQIPARRAAVSLADLVQQVVQGHTAAAEQAGVTLVENLPDDLAPVAGDRAKLLRVFDHLVENAIKFSPRDGQIVVTVEDVGTMMQASVSDQGIGIPRDQQERIFERFYQIDGSTRRRFGGAGMGLAIVKQILEAHDGQVWVESEPGKGSTFYVTIPKYLEPRVN